MFVAPGCGDGDGVAGAKSDEFSESLHSFSAFPGWWVVLPMLGTPVSKTVISSVISNGYGWGVSTMGRKITRFSQESTDLVTGGCEFFFKGKWAFTDTTMRLLCHLTQLVKWISQILAALLLLLFIKEGILVGGPRTCEI